MKNALIIGSSRGNGWACIERMLKDGMTVYMATFQKEIDDNNSWLKKGLHPIVYDAFDSETYSKIFKAVENETNGRLDILVNNFGWADSELNLKQGTLDLDHSNEIIKINTQNVMSCIQKALSLMKQNGGSIVNTAFIAPRESNLTEQRYKATKAAISHITTQSAKELAKYNIRVNAVLPSVTATDGIREKRFLENREFFLHHAPFRRTAEPEEIAAAVISLANSAYTTGQCLEISGGFSSTTSLHADMMALIMQMNMA